MMKLARSGVEGQGCPHGAGQRNVEATARPYASRAIG
jgi:hypothetical protein